MPQQAPPADVVLHCEVEVGGKTLRSDTLISRRAWDVADAMMREAFRDRARASLAQAIIQQCQPEVTVIDERPSPATLADTEPFNRRYRRCWFGDKFTHAACATGINNSITACGQWVGRDRIDDQIKKGRYAPVTCPGCETTLAILATYPAPEEH